MNLNLTSCSSHALPPPCYTHSCPVIQTYCRWPQGTITYRGLMSEKPLFLTSAVGGLLYARVARGQVWGPRSFTVSGGVDAPYFKLGETAASAWPAIRARAAPWAELATDKVVLTVPARMVRALDDPTALLGVYDAVMDALADFVGVSTARRSAAHSAAQHTSCSHLPLPPSPARPTAPPQPLSPPQPLFQFLNPSTPCIQMPRARAYAERFVLDCSAGLVAGYEQDAVSGYPAIGGFEFHANGADAANAVASLVTTARPAAEEARAKWYFIRSMGMNHVWDAWLPDAAEGDPPGLGSNVLAAVYALETGVPGATRAMALLPAARNEQVASYLLNGAYPGGPFQWNSFHYRNHWMYLQLQGEQ